VVGSTGAFVQVNNIFTGMTTTNTVLNYQGGSDVEYVRATSAADVVNGGAGNDTIAGEAGADILTGEAGSDTFLLANTYSTTQFDTVTDFLIGADAQSDVIGLSEVTIAGVQAQTNFGPAIVRTDGLTIQSYATTATGVVTLYDESTGTGTTEVFARTSADVLAIANALANQELNNETAIFRLDADANGVAESSVIVSQHARGLEIVQLTGVAAVDLNLTATAGDITVSQNNTLIGSDAVDTFFGMAGDDVITGNGGADVITGGLGADTINLGEAVAAADSVVLTTGLTADTVNGFDFGGTATDDDIQFDLSDLETANNVIAATTIDLVALDTAASVAAGAVTLQTVTAGAAAAAGANVFLLDIAGATYANAAAAVDILEAGGAAALTFASNIAADDAFVFAYEITGGGVGIAIANFAAADDNTAGAAATGVANLESAELAVLVGVNDVTTLTAADFAFIA
jgi:Ca2+-binding RTX toxin-like protein